MFPKHGPLRTLMGALFLLIVGTVIGVVLVSDFMPVGQAVDGAQKTRPVESPVLPSNQIFVKIAKAVTPAVVNISTTRTIKSGGLVLPFNDPFFRRFFGEEYPFGGMPRHRKEQSLGSGVIVSSDGLIITNNHVVEEADGIKVLLEDRREFVGKVVGTDKKSDIAVIRIDAKDLPIVPWGNSDQLQVGEYVMAIGNPFGLNQTVTMGIVSAIGRANVGIADYEDFIQTDAAINPGNSGGAMVNIAGELVGINTAIFTRSGGYMGIGFAAPSNMVRSIMDSLVKSGKVVRGWLGVSIQEVTPALAEEFGLKETRGALVTDILPGSPAEKADIERGDVIIGFMGQEITDTGHLRNLVARVIVGTKATVTLVRDKKEKEVSVLISEQPKEIDMAGEEEEAEQESPYFGIEAHDLTPELAEQYDLRPQDRGVLVIGVEPGSPAEESGLREGDLIVEINRKPVQDLKRYREVLSKINKGSALLLVNRKGNRFFLTLTMEKG